VPKTILLIITFPNVTAGSHPQNTSRHASPDGYEIPLFLDKIYRDFQVKGLLRPADRRLAFLKKSKADAIGGIGKLLAPATLSVALPPKARGRWRCTRPALKFG
jgi:hypothetical protein